MSAVILRGDARQLPLPDESVDLIVTSPPYFGLRSYTDGGEHYDGQIGSEATPAEYIASLLDCTREWMRVLKPSGSIFLNIGDKYSGAQQQTHGRQSGEASSDYWRRTDPKRTGIPAKSLMGLPWRYALACMDDLGLILRAEIIWAKPNGLPESVTDRVRRAHEQVFRFTRQPRYYSAVDEIREGYAPGTAKRYAAGYNERAIDGKRLGIGVQLGGDTYGENPLGKLPGSVWDIPSQPLIVPPHLGVDHFAAYPLELPRRIILGWSPPGICLECGEGRRPVSAKAANGRTEDPSRWSETVAYFPAEGRAPIAKTAFQRGVTHTITGYACACPEPTAPTRPAVVLDPFAGTGTTMLAASVLGRTGIGTDRSADYCRLARWRCSDPGERAKAMQVPKPPVIPDGQLPMFAEVPR